MTTVLITNTFEPSSGFDFDTVVSSFVLHTQTTFDDAARLVAFDEVADFYRQVPTGGTLAVGAYISGAISRAAGAVEMKMYDITGHADGSNYGSPVATSSFALPTPNDDFSLPPQVASVLTLRARGALAASVELGDGTRPRARLTGRTYIGPLSQAAMQNTAGVPARPKAAFISNVLAAAETLQDALNAAGWTWCVWSRSNALFRAVTSVEMDDSFDVLRSRQVAATSRSKRVFVPEPSLALGA